MATSWGFFVAKDCKGKTASPDTVLLCQFTGRQAIDSGAPKIKAAFPRRPGPAEFATPAQ